MSSLSPLESTLIRMMSLAQRRAPLGSQSSTHRRPALRLDRTIEQYTIFMLSLSLCTTMVGIKRVHQDFQLSLVFCRKEIAL